MGEGLESAPPRPSRPKKSIKIDAVHTNYTLAFAAVRRHPSMMRTFMSGLLVCLVPVLAVCTSMHIATADQNPTPTNVGLYNYSTFTVATNTAIPLLPRNKNRAGLIMQNNGATSIVIKPGSVPANATDGIVMIAGAVLQINPPPVDAIYGISASSTDKIVMIENVK